MTVKQTTRKDIRAPKRMIAALKIEFFESAVIYSHHDPHFGGATGIMACS
jgi:alkyl sulfatase BDS1-like metallo-beta-lactamase superfamily hydrolase